MDLSTGCQTSSLPSSLADADESRFEPDLMITLADIKKRLIMKTEFEKEVITECVSVLMHVCLS